MTTTNQTDAQMKLADVTDADREAAAEWDRMSWHEYEGDWLGDLSQSFAQHRIIAIQATEARAQGLVEAERERCARIVERRAEARFAENGTREWDTNATYYQGGMAEIYEALDEEADEIADAIRNSQHGGERER